MNPVHSLVLVLLLVATPASADALAGADSLVTSPHKATEPLSSGASTVNNNENKGQTELVLRLGNESNRPDGMFGPATYGFRGSHTFENQMTLEGGYIRLHEPGSATLDSVVDEAQITLRFPEAFVLGQPLVLGGTAWKNRMIDMYTNVGGLELTRHGAVSLNVGIYLGKVTREESIGNFYGAKLGASGTLGPIEWALSHLNGRISLQEPESSLTAGFYRKTAAELAAPISVFHRLPLALTFALEDRFFNFGASGPASDPQDELIFVSGLEVHFEEFL